MLDWPENYENSWTLASPVFQSGIGLHFGEQSQVRLLPFDKPGFWLSLGFEDQPPLKLSIDMVRHTPLCTSIDFSGYRIFTVEHLFAALIGCGLSHIHIQLSGKEIPLLDGSSLGWVDSIKKAGMVPAKTLRDKAISLDSPIILNKDSSLICATPSEKFKLIGIIDFPYAAIGKQVLSIELTPDKFIREIAPARTFGFLDQITQLKNQGLIKGGGVDNALICDGDHWVNPPLRFEDEPVRHKMLDLIGDFALVGLPRAQILVYRGSHSLHTEMAAALHKNCS